MLFYNIKIQCFVPYFNFKIRFLEGIKYTVENYQNNKRLQVINYFWEGRMDYLLSKSGKGRNYSCPQNIGVRAMLDYYRGRYAIVGKMFGAWKKLKNLVK